MIAIETYLSSNSDSSTTFQLQLTILRAYKEKDNYFFVDQFNWNQHVLRLSSTVTRHKYCSYQPQGSSSMDRKLNNWTEILIADLA